MDVLVLSRKKGESIMIGDSIEIVVLDSESDVVKIGITAPRHVEILRKELYAVIRESNLESSIPSDAMDQLPKIKSRKKVE
jgi:carbon storage regulator